MKNRSFLKLLVIFSIIPMALMGFLAAGSYIYIDHFGLTEQQFSYAFAFNALCASFGPTIYMKLSYRMPVQKVISGCFALLALAGIFTLTIRWPVPLVLYVHRCTSNTDGDHHASTGHQLNVESTRS